MKLKIYPVADNDILHNFSFNMLENLLYNRDYNYKNNLMLFIR